MAKITKDDRIKTLEGENKHQYKLMQAVMVSAYKTMGHDLFNKTIMVDGGDEFNVAMRDMLEYVRDLNWVYCQGKEK